MKVTNHEQSNTTIEQLKVDGLRKDTKVSSFHGRPNSYLVSAVSPVSVVSFPGRFARFGPFGFLLFFFLLPIRVPVVLICYNKFDICYKN